METKSTYKNIKCLSDSTILSVPSLLRWIANTGAIYLNSTTVTLQLTPLHVTLHYNTNP